MSLDEHVTNYTYEFSPQRTLEPGWMFKVSGERGDFRFLSHVTTTTGDEWINARGGKVGREKDRAFLPSRITKVWKPRER
jgi:hypothetical protein